MNSRSYMREIIQQITLIQEKLQQTKSSLDEDQLILLESIDLFINEVNQNNDETIIKYLLKIKMRLDCYTQSENVSEKKNNTNSIIAIEQPQLTRFTRSSRFNITNDIVETPVTIHQECQKLDEMIGLYCSQGNSNLNMSRCLSDAYSPLFHKSDSKEIKEILFFHLTDKGFHVYCSTIENAEKMKRHLTNFGFKLQQPTTKANPPLIDGFENHTQYIIIPHTQIGKLLALHYKTDHPQKYLNDLYRGKKLDPLQCRLFDIRSQVFEETDADFYKHYFIKLKNVIAKNTSYFNNPFSEFKEDTNYTENDPRRYLGSLLYIQNAFLSMNNSDKKSLASELYSLLSGLKTILILAENDETAGISTRLSRHFYQTYEMECFGEAAPYVLFEATGCSFYMPSLESLFILEQQLKIHGIECKSFANEIKTRSEKHKVSESYPHKLIVPIHHNYKLLYLARVHPANIDIALKQAYENQGFNFTALLLSSSASCDNGISQKMQAEYSVASLANGDQIIRMQVKANTTSTFQYTIEFSSLSDAKKCIERLNISKNVDIRKAFARLSMKDIKEIKNAYYLAITEQQKIALCLWSAPYFTLLRDETLETMALDLQKQIELIDIPTITDMNAINNMGHVIILLDDSGSMGGNKMTAANKSCINLIEELPNNTCITLIPFNKAPLFNACPKAKLPGDWKNNILSVQATGGTPMVSTIVKAAASLSSRCFTPIETLKKATFILLTDGAGDNSETAEEILEAVRTGLFKKQDVSQCNHALGTPELPNHAAFPIIPIGIGTGYTKEVIDGLSSFAGGFHIRDDANMESDLIEMTNSVKQTFGYKIGPVYAGLYCPDTKKILITIDVDIMLPTSSRCIYKRLPNNQNTNNLEVIICVESELGSTQLIKSNNDNLLVDYFGSQLDSLFEEFASKKGTIQITTSSSRFSRQPSTISINNSSTLFTNETKSKFSDIQEKLMKLTEEIKLNNIDSPIIIQRIQRLEEFIQKAESNKLDDNDLRREQTAVGRRGRGLNTEDSNQINIIRSNANK